MNTTDITAKIDRARALLIEAAEGIVPMDTLGSPDGEACGLLYRASGIADDAALLLEQADERR